MYDKVSLENVGPFGKLDWGGHGGINVIVGENDTGKSYLLKLLYLVVRSLQEQTTTPGAGRWAETLARKAQGVFMPPNEQLGQLVRKGQKQLSVDLRLCDESFHFSFGPDTQSTIVHCTGIVSPLVAPRAVYMPPKEVLTIRGAVAQTRADGIHDFDDTYLDLVRDLALPVQRGRIEQHLSDAMASIEHVVGGAVEEHNDEFVMRRGQTRFSMSQTAEGCKKVGILTRLIKNRTLRKGTVLFVDEPEVNLHPRALAEFVRILHLAVEAGLQVYVATHSYFALKELEMLAVHRHLSMPVLSISRDKDAVRCDLSDLRDGMPDNAIVHEAVEQYRRDVDLSLNCPPASAPEHGPVEFERS